MLLKQIIPSVLAAKFFLAPTKVPDSFLIDPNALTVFVFAFDIFLLYYAFRLVKAYRLLTMPNVIEWQKEVSPPSPLPAPYAATDVVMRNLGLQEFAVLQVKFYQLRITPYSWVYRSEDNKTLVEIAFNLQKMPVVLQISSFFPDDAMLITRYPRGEAVVNGMFQARFARRSIAAAYNYHMLSLQTWRREHGEPLAFETVSDITHFEDVFAQKYKGISYARQRRITLEMLACVVLAIILMITWRVTFDQNLLVAFLIPIALFLISGRMFFISRSIRLPPNAIDDPRST